MLPSSAAAIQRHRVVIFFIGIAFMWTGIAFRYYAMRVLGRYFTFDVATVAGQNVIEAGPYRYIRHPSYTGGIVTILGLGIALGNWAGLFDFSLVLRSDTPIASM